MNSDLNSDFIHVTVKTPLDDEGFRAAENNAIGYINWKYLRPKKIKYEGCFEIDDEYKYDYRWSFEKR